MPYDWQFRGEAWLLPIIKYLSGHSTQRQTVIRPLSLNVKALLYVDRTIWESKVYDNMFWPTYCRTTPNDWTRYPFANELIVSQ